MTLESRFRLMLALIFCVIVENKSIAAIVSWDGGGITNHWSELANWDGDILPSTTDDVLLIAGSNVLLDISPTIKSLSVENANLEISATSHLVIVGSMGTGLACDSSSVINNGLLSLDMFGDKAIVLSGTSVLSNNDSLIIEASQITSVQILSEATLNNSGIVQIDSADQGIQVFGTLNNFNKMLFTAAIYGGIIQAGIKIEDSGIVQNHPSAVISFSNPGAKSLGILNGGQLTNDGKIMMHDLKNGGISSDGLIENNDTIEISTLDSLFGSTSTAIFNSGSGQINNNLNGVILLSNIGDNNERSIVNYSVFDNFGEIHFLHGEVKQVIENDGSFGTAEFNNHSLISISDCKGVGIQNGSIDATFFNVVGARIIMNNCTNGLYNFGPFTNDGMIEFEDCGQAYFSSNSPSELTNNDTLLISNCESGLRVGFGSSFVNGMEGLVQCQDILLYGLSIVGDASLENMAGGEMFFLNMDFFQIEVQMGSTLVNQGIFSTANDP